MVSRERDRIERQRFEQQLAAEQREAEEKRLAPVRAAEAELRKTAGKLRATERESALHGTGDFETAFGLLSDAMKAITPDKGITESQASAFNEREALKFAESTPAYYSCPENANLMASFCSRHGIGVADAETWGNVFRYLDGLGLMQHAPAPEPEPVIEAPAAPAQPQTVIGRDLVTGAPREWHPSELDRLSASDYRKALDLPTVQVVRYRENQTRW